MDGFDRPAAGDRYALSSFDVALGFSVGVVREVVAVAEGVRELVGLVGLDRFLDGEEIGVQLLETGGEGSAPARPVAAAAPQVERRDAH